MTTEAEEGRITAYYKYDLPTVARKIMDSFTEEEE